MAETSRSRTRAGARVTVRFSKGRRLTSQPSQPSLLQLADAKAEATSTQRRLEDLVEEAQDSLSSLQVEHQESLVQKGLLIGSNKSLQERVESLVEVMEEQRAVAEERLEDFEADREAQNQAKQREHERRVAELDRKLQEMEQDMRKKLMDQVGRSLSL